MKATNVLSVRLDPEDLERLKAEAARMGIRPGALAQAYIRAGLSANDNAEARRRAGLEALDHLARLRHELREAGYPSVDAVELVRQGREELEERSLL